MKSNRPEILELIKEVEKTVSRPIRTTNDFSFLSGCIMERCKTSLSSTTLKRIWGYIDGYEETRFTTLSILSQFAGFNDWEDYLDYLAQKSDVQSNEVLSPCIRIEDLEVGDRIELGWLPNRRCLVEYQGNRRFKVLEAENSKLNVSDTFCCAMMIKNEPLYVDNLIQGDEVPKLFVIGRKGGLVLVEKVSKL